MTIVDVIKKALLPLAAMAFWLWMVKTIMGVTGNPDQLRCQTGSV